MRRERIMQLDSMGKQRRFSKLNSQLQQCSSPSCSCWWNAADSKFCSMCATPLTPPKQSTDSMTEEEKARVKGKGRSSWPNRPREPEEESNFVQPEKPEKEKAAAKAKHVEEEPRGVGGRPVGRQSATQRYLLCQ